MDTTAISETSRWVLSHHGYWLMFIGMLIEGPALTAAGAFGAALGYFNIYLVLLLSILGNLIPDVIYYAVGFWGRLRLVDKYGHYLGVTKDRVASIEGLIEKHAGKALAAIKLIPFLATPGLIVAGATRMSLKKYVWWSLAITLPSSLLYLIVGYYFGAAYDTIEHYLNLGGYLVLIVIAVFFLISYLGKKIAKRIGEKIERA